MHILWKLLLLVLFQNDIVVKSQLACSSTEYYTVLETHRSSLTTYIAYRTRSKLQCCSGYFGHYPDCEKICNQGYELRNGDCEPICNVGCSAGYCYEPHSCEDCDLGFELSGDGDCQPTCSMECEHGFCSAPEKCSCHSGYKMNDLNFCEAVCDEGCFNGKCLEPNGCYCDHGFELRNKDCHPICEVSCENGFCSSPYKCVCLEGYRKNSDDFCEPICAKGCLTNHCSTPYNCDKCAPGYFPFHNGSLYCKPICDNCGFGDCISPGVCMCWQGYVMDDWYSCSLPASEITTLHQNVESSTYIILEQSMPVTVKETASESPLIETKTDEFDSEYSTLKLFKDDFISNIIPTTEPEEVLEKSEVLDNISPPKPTSTRNWMPRIIVGVAVLLIVAVAIGKSFLIRNKRYKARCNSQFLVTFNKENKNVDCILFEN